MIASGQTSGHAYFTIILAQCPGEGLSITKYLHDCITDCCTAAVEDVSDCLERCGERPTALFSVTFKKEDATEYCWRSLRTAMQEMKRYAEGRNERPTFQWNLWLHTWCAFAFTQRLNRKEQQIITVKSSDTFPFHSETREAEATK